MLGWGGFESTQQGSPVHLPRLLKPLRWSLLWQETALVKVMVNFRALAGGKKS